MVVSRQLAKRAQKYDQLERASDHGIGRPGGPTGWRKPRAPSAIGNAARMRRLRKQAPEFHARVMAGELTVNGAVAMAFNPKPKGPTKIMSTAERWEAGLLKPNEAQLLERKWREEFFRSLAPGFTYDDGARGVLVGRAAHIAHLVDQGIHPSFCEYLAAGDDAT
jgi:hypothetical protein